jgi:hypothetical protein
VQKKVQKKCYFFAPGNRWIGGPDSTSRGCRFAGLGVLAAAAQTAQTDPSQPYLGRGVGLDSPYLGRVSEGGI